MTAQTSEKTQEIVLGDIVRLIKPDGSKSDQLYVTRRSQDDDAFYITSGDGILLGPYKQNILYRQHIPSIVYEQLKTESDDDSDDDNKDSHPHVDIDDMEFNFKTGFKTENELKRWHKKMHNVAIKKDGNWLTTIKRSILTFYSAKSYLASYIKVERIKNSQNTRYEIEVQFKYERHKPRDYHGNDFAHILHHRCIGYDNDDSDNDDWVIYEARYSYTK